MGRECNSAVYVVAALLLFVAIAEADTPPGIANNPSHARCLTKKYKHCYNLEHVCPKFCPDSCTVECVSCKPICGPGSTPPPSDDGKDGDESSPPSKGTGDDDKGKGDDDGGKGNSSPPSGGKGDDDNEDGGKGKGDGDGGKGKGDDDANGGKGKGDDGKTPPNPPTPSTPPYSPSPPPSSPPPSTPTTPPTSPSPPPSTPPSSPTPTPSPSPPPPSASPPTTPSTPPTSPSPPPSSPPPSTPTTPPTSPSPPPSTPPYSPTPSPPPSSPPPTPTTPTTPPTSPSPPPSTPPSSPPPPTPTPPSSPASSPYSPPESDAASLKRKRCKNRNYPQCYGIEHVCPSSCPSTCEVDCVTCKPVCQCDMPGAVCQDPRFIGGDGLTFYFHGKKDRDFCLVTDPNLHINAHFIGKRNRNMKRDFTWVQSIAILFGNHHLLIAAQKTATWDDSVERLSLSFDGEPIPISTIWKSGTATIERDSDTNSVVVEVEGLFKISAKVVPITQQESRIHNYGITEDDCFAHLELGFKLSSLNANANGVLGQTYRQNYVSRAKMGVAMPVLGGEREFAVSNIFATDCAVSQFRRGEMLSEYEEDVLELPTMKCGTGIDGRGVVCKR
ncbi:hypothetical protein SASPL_131973 [Salvia splendens]|uniref:Uncharacterized protein n=1 Tax=Salvia splendens TaxID=180675 RepID=A0A8X8X6V2_SALSN|nr:uncharacterized protein LOC121754807 [Salvia splendens]KAG6408945.1 hypothetical protein SASPL_131973 [Salvia splendens]